MGNSLKIFSLHLNIQAIIELIRILLNLHYIDEILSTSSPRNDIRIPGVGILRDPSVGIQWNAAIDSIGDAKG